MHNLIWTEAIVVIEDAPLTDDAEIRGNVSAEQLRRVRRCRGRRCAQRNVQSRRL